VTAAKEKSGALADALEARDIARTRAAVAEAGAERALRQAEVEANRLRRRAVQP
jgi:hypothetical protein